MKKASKKKQTIYCIIPIENSYCGMILETVDIFTLGLEGAKEAAAARDYVMNDTFAREGE